MGYLFADDLRALSRRGRGAVTRSERRVRRRFVPDAVRDSVRLAWDSVLLALVGGVLLVVWLDLDPEKQLRTLAIGLLVVVGAQLVAVWTRGGRITVRAARTIAAPRERAFDRVADGGLAFELEPHLREHRVEGNRETFVYLAGYRKLVEEREVLEVRRPERLVVSVVQWRVKGTMTTTFGDLGDLTRITMTFDAAVKLGFLRRLTFRQCMLKAMMRYLDRADLALTGAVGPTLSVLDGQPDNGGWFGDGRSDDVRPAARAGGFDRWRR